MSDTEPTIESAAEAIAEGLARIMVWSDESPSDPHLREGVELLKRGLEETMRLFL